MKVEVIKEVLFKESSMMLTGTKKECEDKIREMRKEFGEGNVIIVTSHDYSNISLNKYEVLVNIKLEDC